MDIDEKVPSKIFANWIQQLFEKLTHTDKIHFIPAIPWCLNTGNSVNVITRLTYILTTLMYYK